MAEVVIDPGHGGRDCGAVAMGMKEKDLLFKLERQGDVIVGDGIANRLVHLLRKRGISAVLTRQSDVYTSKKKRWATCSPDTHLYVSLHANASSNSTANGYEIYSNIEAKGLAEIIDASLVMSGIKSRGIRSVESNKRVMACIKGVLHLPVLLIEVGFITNVHDLLILKSKAGRKIITEIISDKIISWLNLKMLNSGIS